jgi:hypothetical protein
MTERPPFWFAAKRYGYGWGLPVRWEGWVVFAAYVALLYAGIRYIFEPASKLGLGIYIAVLTAVLVAIVFIKGERPLRWRWGKD